MRKLEGWCPPEAEVFYQPRVESAEPARRLRRWDNRRKVVPAQNWTQIFNGDDRRILFDTSYPWRCVGRLQTEHGACTAALVGRNLILTAAHCLPWESLWRAPMAFVPAYDRSSSRLGTSFTSIVNGVAWWEATTDQCGYDMAVCRIDVPLGDSIGFFGVQEYDDAWEDLAEFMVVGYPWDLGGGLRPTVETHVAVVDDDSDAYSTLEIETKSDSASGMSGGPIFSWWDGDPRVIGTFSGWEEEFDVGAGGSAKHSLFSGGAGLLGLVAWARANWS